MQILLILKSINDSRHKKTSNNVIGERHTYCSHFNSNNIIILKTDSLKGNLNNNTRIP